MNVEPHPNQKRLHAQGTRAKHLEDADQAPGIRGVGVLFGGERCPFLDGLKGHQKENRKFRGVKSLFWTSHASQSTVSHRVVGSMGFTKGIPSLHRGVVFGRPSCCITEVISRGLGALRKAAAPFEIPGFTFPFWAGERFQPLGAGCLSKTRSPCDVWGEGVLWRTQPKNKCGARKWTIIPCVVCLVSHVGRILEARQVVLGCP